MALNGSDFSKYLAAHARLRERERLALPARASRARRAALEAAQRIGVRTSASRVLLFGSLARGSFGSHSDIDLAVEGLRPGELVDALAAAESGCPFRVDVLPLDSARPAVVDAIRKDGEVLWVR
jgi:predicted nucleotidyltransferase